jgi:hypothetical protein
MLKNTDMVWWSVLLGTVWELYFTLNRLYIITVSHLLISVFCLSYYFIDLGQIQPLVSDSVLETESNFDTP